MVTGVWAVWMLGYLSVALGHAPGNDGGISRRQSGDDAQQSSGPDLASGPDMFPTSSTYFQLTQGTPTTHAPSRPTLFPSISRHTQDPGPDPQETSASDSATASDIIATETLTVLIPPTTSPAPTQSTLSEPRKPSGLSSGAVAALATALTLGLLSLTLGGCLYMRRRRQKLRRAYSRVDDDHIGAPVEWTDPTALPDPASKPQADANVATISRKPVPPRSTYYDPPGEMFAFPTGDEATATAATTDMTDSTHTSDISLSLRIPETPASESGTPRQEDYPPLEFSPRSVSPVSMIAPPARPAKDVSGALWYYR